MTNTVNFDDFCMVDAVAYNALVKAGYDDTSHILAIDDPRDILDIQHIGLIRVERLYRWLLDNGIEPVQWMTKWVQLRDNLRRTKPSTFLRYFREEG